MVRDYTSAKQDSLLAQINKVTANGFFERVGDFFGDCWLQVQEWSGRLNVKNYLDNVDSYHNKILDLKNTKKEELNRIFEAARAVDDQTQGKIVDCYCQLGVASAKFDQFISVLDLPKSCFTAVNIRDFFSGKTTVSKIVEQKAREDKAIELEKTGGKIDMSQWDYTYSYYDANGNYIGKWFYDGGCTWYAFARYREVNGSENELRFKTYGGNANRWDQTIDTSLFDVTYTKDAGASAVKPNSIAVSNEVSGKGDFGCHVLYIEAVVETSEGPMVYYSDGHWGDKSQNGKVDKMRMDQFIQLYECVITAK